MCEKNLLYCIFLSLVFLFGGHVVNYCWSVGWDTLIHNCPMSYGTSGEGISFDFNKHRYLWWLQIALGKKWYRQSMERVRSHSTATLSLQVLGQQEQVILQSNSTIVIFCLWTIFWIGITYCIGPTGEIVASANDNEEAVLVAEFDLANIKCKRHSWGIFRDRRPDLYKVLLTLDGSNPQTR